MTPPTHTPAVPQSFKLAPAQRNRLRRFGATNAVDIHCHCLPGLDDGPRNWESALRLCRALMMDGFTSVVATPHQLGRYGQDNSAQIIRDRVAELNHHLNEQQLPLHLFAGADVRVDECIPSMLDEDEVLTVGDRGRAILLEVPHDIWIDPVALLDELQDRDILPVLTHPERHETGMSDPNAVQPWLEHGAVLQVTAGSLTGRFGERPERTAWWLMEQGWVSLVATDAHNAHDRSPCMSSAIERISARMGEETARVLCSENPQALTTENTEKRHKLL